MFTPMTSKPDSRERSFLSDCRAGLWPELSKCSKIEKIMTKQLLIHKFLVNPIPLLGQIRWSLTRVGSNYGKTWIFQSKFSTFGRCNNCWSTRSIFPAWTKNGTNARLNWRIEILDFESKITLTDETKCKVQSMLLVCGSQV